MNFMYVLALVFGGCAALTAIVRPAGALSCYTCRAG